MHIDDNLRAGMTPEEARREALVKLGGLEQTKQAYRERGTVPFVRSLLHDVRFACARCAKKPGFAFTAVLVLGAGHRRQHGNLQRRRIQFSSGRCLIPMPAAS